MPPVNGTREWATNSHNCVRGCSHDCAYCYAHCIAKRFGRMPASGRWADEEAAPGWDRPVKRYKGAVMYPTTHDLTPGNAQWTLPVLRRLLEAGNHVLVVSKPHPEIIAQITRDLGAYRDLVLFRFTIGTMRPKTLAFFEPGAPGFPERYAALEGAHAAGWRTSVSMEPLLEPEEDRVVELVGDLAPLCSESIWLGKLNKAGSNCAMNGRWDGDHQRAVRIVQESQSDERIRSLVARLAHHRLVRWKESVKAVVGTAIPERADEDWTHAAPLLAVSQ